MKVFIDSNIPMYVAGIEHPHRNPSRRLLAKVQSGYNRWSPPESCYFDGQTITGNKTLAPGTVEVFAVAPSAP